MTENMSNKEDTMVKEAENRLDDKNMEVTGQHSDSADEEISLLDLLEVLSANVRLLIVGPLAVGIIALGYAFTITPTFTAVTKILPPQQQQSGAAALLQGLGALGGMAGAAGGLKNPNDQYVSLLKSRSVADALISRFHLKNRYKQKLSSETVKALEMHTKIEDGKKDGMITISVDDKDPKFAAELANSYVEEFQALLYRLELTSAQQRRAFFEKQLKATKDNLVKAERALQATGVNKEALKNDAASAVGSVAQLQARIAAQEVKVASMRSYLDESSPLFKAATQELGALRGQMAKMERTDTATMNSKNDYIGRFRDFKYYETLYELFAKQFEMAKSDELYEGSTIQVVDPAQPPDRKSKPKKAKIAVIATVATGFILIIFIFIRNSLYQVSRNTETALKLDNIKSNLKLPEPHESILAHIINKLLKIRRIAK